MNASAQPNIFIQFYNKGEAVGTQNTAASETPFTLAASKPVLIAREVKSKQNSKVQITTFIFIFLFVAGFLTVLFRFQIGDLLLRNFGQCAKAGLTSELRSTKYVKPTYMYSFQINGKMHNGNSMIEEGTANLQKQLCVIYVPLMPGINRPLSYFKTVEKDCGCDGETFANAANTGLVK